MKSKINKFGYMEKRDDNLNHVIKKSLGINLNQDKNLNVSTKRIVNLSVPKDDYDAVNKKFLMENYEKLQKNLENQISDVHTILNQSITSDKDLIIQATENQITLSNKQVLADINENFKAIENYLFKLLSSSNDNEADTVIIKKIKEPIVKF